MRVSPIKLIKFEYFFSKLIFATLVVVIAAAFAQGNIFKNFADDRIYDAIEVVLRNQYPDNQKKVQCMVDDFRRNKVADKFYTIDLLTNQEKLSKEIQPYVDEANLKVILTFLQLLRSWGFSEGD